MLEIINGTIVTMAGRTIENGVVVCDEKIQFAGTVEEYDRSRFNITETLDASGKFVTPGLIDAHCHVGMFEDSLGAEGDDGNEDSDPITPHLRAIDGINPFDRAFTEARSAGVTTVVTGPGSANPIGGQFVAMKTAGVCVDDMIIKEPAAMKFALGENPKTVYTDKEQTPVTRMGTAALIRENLYKARDYMTSVDAYNEDNERDKPDYDMKCEALLPVLRREIPVKIHAHRADDICTAIRIAKEFDIRITLEHCTDGEAVLEILKRENLPVMLGPTLTDRSKPELKSMSFSAYKTLSDAGLSVAIITDHPDTPIENLTLCAAVAVKNGMDKDKAMRAITIAAAQNCGISDRVGSIENGKDADMAVFTHMPVEFDARVEATVINGEIVYNI